MNKELQSGLSFGVTHKFFPQKFNTTEYKLKASKKIGLEMQNFRVNFLRFLSFTN